MDFQDAYFRKMFHSATSFRLTYLLAGMEYFQHRDMSKKTYKMENRHPKIL